MSDLGKLVVRLGANIADFSSDMGKAARIAAKRMKQVGDALRTGFGAAAQVAKKMFLGAIGAMVGAGGLGLLVRSSMTAIDKLGKLSTRLGISASALSELQFAAGQTGIKFETLSMGLQRMVRRVAEAAKGTGEAQGALKELNLEAAALARLAPDQQFEALADALNSVPSQADKVRLAMKLFDSEGVALLQTMKGGAAAIRAYRDEARALGASLSQSAVRGVEAANDSVDRLKTLFTGLRDQTVAAFAPALQMAVDKVTSFGKEAITAEGGASKLGQMLAGKLLSAIEAVTVGGAQFANILNRLANPRQAIRADQLAADLVKVNEQIATLERVQARIESGDEKRPHVLASMPGNLEKARAEAARLEKALAEIGDPFDIEKIRAIFADFNNAIGQAAESVEDLSGTEGGKRGLAALGGLFDDAAARAAAYNSEMARAEQIARSILTPQEEFVALLDEAEYLFATGSLSAEQYDKYVAKLQKDLDGAGSSANTFAEQAARNIQDITASLIAGEHTAKSFAASMVDGLRRIASEMLAQQILTSIFGGMAGQEGFWGSFASAVIGKRAAGGSISGGKPYLVGERGPELIVPAGAGTVIPNHRLGDGMGGTTIVNNIDARGAVSIVEMQRVAEAAARKGTADALYAMQRGILPG